MSKTSRVLLGLFITVLILSGGIDFVYAADNNAILNQNFGLSSINSDLQRIFKGITSLARPIVTIMTALAGMMVCLNIGGDHKQKIWNWILGIGLALNFGSVLWYMWGGYADIPAGQQAAAEYSFKVFNESNLTDSGIDTLSQFMKYYLTIIVSGSLQIKPVAIKLLLGLALADMSVRLALDLTDKDKVSWLVKTFLKIGFYIWLINNWLGVDGLNLMDTLSKGFQEIGFMAGNYGEAPLISTQDINGTIDAKHDLAPDSIVNNTYKMFSSMFGASLPQDIPQTATQSPTADTGIIDSIGNKVGQIWGSVTGTAKEMGKAAIRTINTTLNPITSACLAISMLLSVVIAFFAAVEMFMARIEFYTLALLAMPLLAFGVIKHFEYLAQQAIRAVFNCGVKVCVISFLQAVICQMYSKYTAEVLNVLSSTLNPFKVISVSLQMLLMVIIMFLLVSKIPKLIQGLLSGNPSMSGSDMTGTAVGVASTAAAFTGTVVGARAAAASAKQDAANGKSVSAWKMSTMGQMGAALLRRAPITGAAWGAYQDVSRFGSSGNDNQDKRDRENPSTPPNPSKEDPALNNSPSNHDGGSDNSPSGSPANDGNMNPSSPPPVPSSDGPITGAAWGAYQDVSRFGSSGNDNQDKRDRENSSTPPNPSKEDPGYNSPSDHSGGSDNSPSGSPANDGNMNPSSPPPVPSSDGTKYNSGSPTNQDNNQANSSQSKESDGDNVTPSSPPSTASNAPKYSSEGSRNNGTSSTRDEARKEKMNPSSPPPSMNNTTQYQHRMPQRQEIDPTENE